MTASSEDDCPVSADEALARLMEGNARFLRGEPRFTRALTEVLADLVKGQRPFATILCCSDSRVPPELIFDAKIGDLFVVRVAGNVMSPEIGGSLQYAGTHLKTQLFMVLGHEGCGAVQAALAAKFRACRSVHVSSRCLRICFRVLTRSNRSFRHSKSLSAQSNPTSAGPCARFWRPPKDAREWPRAA